MPVMLEFVPCYPFNEKSPMMLRKQVQLKEIELENSRQPLKSKKKSFSPLKFQNGAWRKESGYNIQDAAIILYLVL